MLPGPRECWAVLWEDPTVDAQVRKHFAEQQLPLNVDGLDFPPKNHPRTQEDREALAKAQTKPLIDTLRSIFIRLSDYCHCSGRGNLPFPKVRRSIAVVIKDAADTVNVAHFKWTLPSVEDIGIEVSARLATQRLAWVVFHFYHSHFRSAMNTGYVASLNSFVRHLYEFAHPMGYLRQTVGCETFILRLGAILAEVDPYPCIEHQVFCSCYGPLLPLPEED